MTLIELIALGLLVAIVLTIALVALRRAALGRTGGVDLSWRSDSHHDRAGWVLGQGRFSGESLELFRAFSILPLASKTLDRHDLVIGRRRSAQGTEPDLLPPQSVIVGCTYLGTHLELALSEDALTGLRSWLESAPSDFRGPMLGR